MLTEVKAYSSWLSAPTLPLVADGTPETDLIQIINIEGLEPVKASINTSERGYVDGATFTGSNVPTRNIVLTLRLNPNWDNWTYASLRRLLYSYFLPKKSVRLVFYSDDLDPVEISGIVEDISMSLFSKEPDINVSIICPNPYFVSILPTTVSQSAIRSGGDPTIVTYNGSFENGIYLKVTTLGAPYPTSIEVNIGGVSFLTEATLDATNIFEMSSVPMNKYVQNVNLNTGVITNRLSTVSDGSVWPSLLPGDNEFSVITDQGDQDWELKYFELFGGL